MNNLLEQAKWIWSHNDPKLDEYGEFVDHFTCYEGNVMLQISADSNYADIEKLYTPMIEFGSTTVWETEDGSK